jgi:hypothetical protein
MISTTQQRAMSLEQIRDFLEASQDFRFAGKRREEMYEMGEEDVGQPAV